MQNLSSDPKTYCHQSPGDFVKSIREHLEEGNAFTPFVGSGISSQSGILMSSAFTNYVSYCVWRVLGSPTQHDTPRHERKFWDLMRNGWPPYPSHNEIQDLKKFFLHWFQHYAKSNHHSAETLRDTLLIKEVVPLRGKRKSLANHNFELTRALVPNILRSETIWPEEEALADRKRSQFIPNKPFDLNLSETSLPYITEMAVRSLSHWTDTIEFLASTRVDHRLKNMVLHLEPPDSSIIDSFNQHITRGKNPNLIHNLLSRLTRSLRSHIILTTNFDTLLEQAFQAQKESLHTIAVSTKGNLPAYATVRAQNCLIKLHGDLLETRADSSINSPPAPIDRIRFYQYLRSPEHPHSPPPANFVQSHLLVLGYSASDARCVQLIKYVLDFDPDFKVFWVCHCEQDRHNIDRIFGSYNITPKNSTPPAANQQSAKEQRIHTVVTERTDLLLWELYQAINLSLPGGGYNFKFTHHVPPVHEISSPVPLPHHPSSSQDQKKLDEKRREAFEKIKNLTEVKVISIDYQSGLAGPCRELFLYFGSQRMETLWFELEDHRTPIAFLWELFGAIALRRGGSRSGASNFLPAEILDYFSAQNGNSNPTPPEKLLAAFNRRIKLFIDRFGIEPSNWVIFLYGRNGPGGCTGWGWANHHWSAPEHDTFCTILQQLKNLRFRIIYMPFGNNRWRRNNVKVDVVISRAETDLQKKQPAHPKNITRVDCPVFIEKPYADSPHFINIDFEQTAWKNYLDIFDITPPPFPTPGFEAILNTVFDDFLKVHDPTFNELHRSTRILWLYGLTLFRQSRHSAAMISEAVFPCPWKFNENEFDNDRTRYRRIFLGAPYPQGEHACKNTDDADSIGWLTWLRNKGLFLRKPGGFSWKFRDTRLGIQFILEKAHTVTIGPNPFLEEAHSPLSKTLPQVELGSLKPRIHYWIADWYLKAFHSSGHSNPLVECIYHCARCIHLSPHYTPPSLDKKAEDIAFARIQLAWTAACLMRKAIRNGRSCFQFWCPGLDVKAMFFEDTQKLSAAAELLKEEFQKCFHSKQKSTLAETLCEWLQPGGIIDQEIDELNEVVIAEGFSHRSKPVPTLSSHSISITTTPKKPSNHPKDFSHWTTHDWKKPIFSRLKKLLRDPKKDPYPKQAKDFHRIIRDARFAYLKQWDSAGANPRDLVHLIWKLSTLTYDILRSAKFQFHMAVLKSPTPYKESHQSERWLLICSITYHCLQLCRFIPLDFQRQESELRIRLLSTYGLALGCLKRSSEANRRFNEAHALALTASAEDLPLQLARIHLRRAETSIFCFHIDLDNACLTGPPHTLDPGKAKACFAHLDDAWAAIERGEASLSGLNQSSFWWYRVAVTKLSCLAALARACDYQNVDPKASFPMRRRQYLPDVIEDLLVEALFSAEGDHFRELRALDYAFRASLMVTRIEGPLNFSSKSFLISNLTKQESQTPVHRPHLYAYIREVLTRPKSKETKHLEEFANQLRTQYQI